MSLVDVHRPVEPADARVQPDRKLHLIQHPRAVHLGEPEYERHRRGTPPSSTSRVASIGPGSLRKCLIRLDPQAF